jgi:hypothetical protein
VTWTDEFQIGLVDQPGAGRAIFTKRAAGRRRNYGQRRRLVGPDGSGTVHLVKLEGAMFDDTYGYSDSLTAVGNEEHVRNDIVGR